MFITKKATTLILALTVLCANFLFSNSLSLEDNGDSTWNVNYSSDSDIGGFQFNVDGATINSASGGAAGDAGFMVSTSSSVVFYIPTNQSIVTWNVSRSAAYTNIIQFFCPKFANFLKNNRNNF